MKRWLFVVIPVVLTVLGRSGFIVEGDLFWQARAGMEMLDGAPIIRPDTYSWVTFGKEWTPNSWAWNVVLGFAYKHMGFAGFAVVIAITGAAIFALVILQARRLGSHVWAISVATILGAVGITLWISGRPQVITYIAFLLAIPLTSHILSTKSSPRTTALACVALFAIMAVAINCHLGASVIVPIVATATIAHLIYQRAEMSRGLLLRSALPIIYCTAGTLLSPLFLDIFSHALFVRSESDHQFEWQPGILRPKDLFIIGVTAWAAFLAWKQQRPVIAGAAVACCVLVATAVRFEPLAVLIAVPEYAAWLSRTFKVETKHQKITLVAAWSFFCVILAPLAIAAAIHPGQPAKPPFSKPAVYAIPADCRLLNDYAYGGLIELLRPDVKTSMDGRNDLFGDAALQEQIEVINNSNGHPWLDDHKVDCVLLRETKKRQQLMDSLVNDRNWQTIHADPYARVFKRIGT